MRKLINVIFIMFLLLTTDYGLWTKCGMLANAYAAIPHLINYQGRLTDTSGAPLNGTYALTFRIYDAATAGNLLWEETHSGVVIQKGIFGILLGSVTNLNLPFDKAYFLEIKVGNEVMSPRQQLTSAGYAIRAEKGEDAEKLGGKQPTDYVLATDITSTPVANKAVRLNSNAKLPISALKVYDSGWFAITTGTTYLKTHNLGTTKVITTVYFSPDGSSCVGIMHDSDAYARHYGTFVAGITVTTITLRTAPSYVIAIRDQNGNDYLPTSGYARIIMLALE